MSDELERRLTTPPAAPFDAEDFRAALARRAAEEGVLDVAYGPYDSPLGRLTVIVTPRGLVRL